MYKVNMLYWIKMGNPLVYIYYAIHYINLISLFCLNHAQNQLPYSCRESLEPPENLNPLFFKAWYARIGDVFKSIIVSYSRAIFKGKSKGGRAMSGESNMPPHLTQRIFEDICSFLQGASGKGDKCSIDQGFSERGGEIES